MDLVVHAPRFPEAGETILGGEFATFPGGKGANQAVAATRMGAQVSMVGRVGDDAYGVEMRRVLEAEGIDTSAVLTTKGTPTGVAVITVAEGGGNAIVVAPGANGKMTPKDVERMRGEIERADVVLMQLEVPLSTVIRAAEIARAAGKSVILNAAPAVPLPASIDALIDLLIVNETEAQLITSGAAPANISRVIRDFHETPNGVKRPVESDERVGDLLERLAGLTVPSVLTLGEHGAAWVGERTAWMIDAPKVEPIDTVGAGDAFCGALATRWVRTSAAHPESTSWFGRLRGAKAGALDPGAAEGLREHIHNLQHARTAIELACAAGALATTRRGAIPSLPRADDVDSLLREIFRRRHGNP
jgi:ribokinase